MMNDDGEHENKKTLAMCASCEDTPAFLSSGFCPSCFKREFPIVFFPCECGDYIQTNNKNWHRVSGNCRYWLPCPACMKVMKHDLIENHETTDCPARLVDCDFSKFGCCFQPQFQHINEHNEKFNEHHQMLRNNYYDVLERENENLKIELNMKIKDEGILLDELEKHQKLLQSKEDELKCLLNQDNSFDFPKLEAGVFMFRVFEICGFNPDDGDLESLLSKLSSTEQQKKKALLFNEHHGLNQMQVHELLKQLAYDADVSTDEEFEIDEDETEDETNREELVDNSKFNEWGQEFDTKDYMVLKIGKKSQQPPFVCTEANCKFSTRAENCFLSHRKCHKNPNQQNIFRCQICHYLTKNKGHLIEHNDAKHTGIKRHSCDYPLCTYQGFRIGDVVKHKKRTHPEQII